MINSKTHFQKLTYILYLTNDQNSITLSNEFYGLSGMGENEILALSAPLN
jgi:hypothetical protein